MISISDLTLSAGARELLSGATLQVNPGERVGLVGRNGTGKTTLLRVLAGQLRPEGGSVRVPAGENLGYLPQDAVSGSTRPLWDEVRSGLTRILALERNLESATEALDGSPERITAHAQAEELFRAAGGYSIDERIGSTLWGLGFKVEDWRRSCQEFSGGWQMRIALARLLVAQPQVLLLDEPTNHLDLHARSWLAHHLAQYEGIVLLVSHDRWVLDRVCSHVVELRAARLWKFTGDFSSFVRQRSLADAQRQSQAQRQQEEIDKLQRYVDRFGAKASKASQAQSKAKRLEKIEAQRVEEIVDDGAPRLRFTAGRSTAEVLLALSGVSAGWTHPLFSGLNLDLRAGERWVVLGANGTGKSTLMKVLADVRPPLSGRRVLGHRAVIGYYEQDQAAALSGELSGLQHVLEQAPFCTETRARSALGALGLSGEDALRPISTLSGGEKARVALAGMAVRPLDILLLDEPTNHLDAMTNEVLAGALAEFPGVVVLISHDRHLVEALATHVLRFDGTTLLQREGLRPEDLEPPKPPAHMGSSGAVSADGGESHKDRQRRLRELERQRQQLAAAETKVTQLEAALEELDAQLEREAGDPKSVLILLKRREALHRDLDAAMARWEELEGAQES